MSLYTEYKGLASYEGIRRILTETGHSIRQNDYYAKKFTYDEDYFKTIDNEHKAYWLGFIAADGCVKKNSKLNMELSIALSSADRDHLLKLRNDLKYDGEVKDYVSKHNKGYSRLLITNGPIGYDLMNLGVQPNKSLTKKFENFKVPSELLRHFVRGYFDGNGCITHTFRNNGAIAYKINVCSTESMLRALEYVLGREPRKLDKRHKDDKDNYQLCIGGRHQVKKALDYMYMDADIYLQRKYDKYLEFLRFYNSPSCK